MKKKIIALCLSALSVAFMLTACGSPDSTVTTTPSITQTQTTNSKENQSEQAYSKGVVEDDVYLNEWLNLKLRIPDGYTNASEEIYQRLEDAGGDDCGMYFLNDQSDSIVVSFLDLSQRPEVTEDDYIEGFSKQLVDMGQGTVLGDVGNTEIASKTFRSIHFENVGGKIQSYYVYKNNDIMCYILISGASVEDNEKFASQFTTIEQTIE